MLVLIMNNVEQIVVSSVKKTIKDLQNLQEQYFADLVNRLNLTKEGEGFLFDFIYNSFEEESSDFYHYFTSYGKTVNEIFNKKHHVFADSDLSTASSFDACEHMSSYEPCLETSFSGNFDVQELTDDILFKIGRSSCRERV